MSHFGLFQYRGHTQGHKVIYPGVIWKVFITWLCKLNMKSPSLTVHLVRGQDESFYHRHEQSSPAHLLPVSQIALILTTRAIPRHYTIIDFCWGLLVTMKTLSGISWLTLKVNQYLTRSSWSWVDWNQKSIIALLNYWKFSFTKAWNIHSYCFLSHLLR